MHKFLPTSLALVLATPFGAFADSSSDLTALRREVESLRAAYEMRLQSLEQRLKAAEAAAAGAAPIGSAAGAAVVTVPATIASASAPAAAAPITPTAAVAGLPASRAQTADAAAMSPSSPGAVRPPPPAMAAASPPAAGAVGGNAFNPSISLILSGTFSRSSRDPADYAIAGFPLPPGAAIGPGTRGFSLGESELALSASIDPWFRGAAFFALRPDNTVSVEEAFVQTSALGNGLSVKAGRFYSGIGYLNPQHAHVWDFVDNPLAYQALLGTQYGDDGVQLTWLAPTDRYLEIGAELGRGRGYPGSDSSRNGAGMAALFAHTGGDIGESHSWRAGLSVLDARASGQALLAADPAGRAIAGAFTGSSRVWIADGVWKWAPGGNATRTSFKLQGEYLHATRSGSLTVDPAGSNQTDGYRVAQSGWYVQGVYQFLRHWRAGLRTERLDSGSPDYGLNAAALADGRWRPRRNSLLVELNPSEFSRVRLQLARDQAREGRFDNQLFLQYQMSLGAHGAHRY